ncbi:MAG: ATP-binding protein [Proteobacteria bacterium]|nr:ATP-binding protein [Pseudomonadota bacterium]
MRTLSARILLGFAALTIAFGVIIGTVVANMTNLEGGMVLIGTGLVPLAFAANDLDRKQEDLESLLERFPTETNPRQDLIRKRRDRDLAIGKAESILEALDAVEIDPSQTKVARHDLGDLRTAAGENGAYYEQLIAAMPLGAAAFLDEKHRASLGALQQLRRREHQSSVKTRLLNERTQNRVENIAPKLTAAGHQVRNATVVLGLVAVTLGLLTTIWVVIALRPLRRLRAAARQVAAGDYASRIPEDGPTEVAELAREFNSMGLAVEERERELVRSERLAAVGKMAAMITHEVRNPLSSIGLNTELLEEELVGSANEVEARGLCRAITHEVDRLTAITEEYLSFARLPKPKIAPEAVNPMVNALAAFVRQDLAQRKVELVVALGDDDPIALVDASQLRQCLINLVRNASEAVVAKGGGHVTLRTRRSGERVAIDVEDDGIGIAPDVLPRLFDSFFSTKEGGSGLGLALTKQIVKDHGGDLDVKSVVGQGTTFTVSVPAGTAIALHGRGGSDADQAE